MKEKSIRARNRSRVSGQGGQAMTMVMVILSVAFMLPLAVFAQVVAQKPEIADSQSYNAGLSAALAGASDYLEHLNSNPNYWTYTSDPSNAAFTSCVAVPADPSECFSYSVNNTLTAGTGQITLTSTGKVNGYSRSIAITIAPASFLNYLYFTNYETLDPALYSDPTQAAKECDFYAYQLNTYDNNGTYGPDPSYCTDIYFGTGDSLTGPVHSNDEFRVCGNPIFSSTVSTGDTSTSDSPYWIGDDRCANAPTFQDGIPTSNGVLSFPPDDSSIATQAQPGSSTGCLYTGPTTITLAANGTMSVSSPATKSTGATCGNPAPAGCLASTCSGLALPANGVIYVQDIPASPSDPNYWASCPDSNPIAGLTCSMGDGIVSGTLKGQLTIATADSVVITGNTTYADGTGWGSTDILGLLADNDVFINHPVSCTSSCSNAAGSISDPTVDAAIMAINHSFTVMNYADGSPLGSLTVTGAIIQDFRGPVGTSSGGVQKSGYTKSYTYDSRLSQLTPPFFLDPLQNSWLQKGYSDVTTNG